MKKFLILIAFSGLVFGCEDDEEVASDEVNDNYLLINSPTATITDSDPFQLLGVEVNDQVLMIDVSYSGGCEDHIFEIVWPQIITAVFPPDFEVVLNHNANDDSCEALITQQLEFDFGESGLGLSDLAIEGLRVTVINGYDRTQQVSNR